MAEEKKEVLEEVAEQAAPEQAANPTMDAVIHDPDAPVITMRKLLEANKHKLADTAYNKAMFAIEEINELIQSGAEFKEDGTISMPEVSSDNEKVSNATSTIDEENNLTDNSEHDLILSNEKSIFPIVVGISAGVLLGVLVLLFKIKKDRKKRKDLEKRLTQKVVSEEQIPYEEEKHE